MAVTLSGSRFPGAFSSCDSEIIDGTSALRSGVVGCFFLLFLSRLVFPRTKTKKPRERETKSRKKTGERDEESRRDGDD